MAFSRARIGGLIDVVGRRPVRRRMAGGPPWRLGLWGALPAAKGRGLAVLAPLEFVELAAQRPQLLLPVGDLRFEGRDAAVARLTARAGWRRVQVRGSLRGAQLGGQPLAAGTR
jgi:hypothetical protein